MKVLPLTNSLAASIENSLDFSDLPLFAGGVVTTLNPFAIPKDLSIHYTALFSLCQLTYNIVCNSFVTFDIEVAKCLFLCIAIIIFFIFSST